MPGANCVFPQRGEAAHHVGVGVFKRSTQKADVTTTQLFVKGVSSI